MMQAKKQTAFGISGAVSYSVGGEGFGRGGGLNTSWKRKGVKSSI